MHGLSDTGREQVGRLRDRLLDTGELAEASALYASVMPRAIETAELLAPALGGLEVRPECDFCEGHPGEADGLTWARARRALPRRLGVDHRLAACSGLGDVAGDGATRRTSARPPSWSGTRARPSSWPATAAWWCTRCCTSWRSTSPVAAPAAWIAPDNSSLTEWLFAANPYEKATLPVQLVRYNDHAHLGAVDRKQHSI